MSFQYREAGRLLSGALQKKGSLKTLAFSETDDGDENARHRRKMFAIVCQTLRYMPLLEKISAIDEVKEKLFAPGVVRETSQAWVMLYDLLFGKGSIQGGGTLKRHIEQFEAPLRDALTQMKIQRGFTAEDSAELLLPGGTSSPAFPRYARVNFMKTTVDNALSELRKDGHTVETDDIVPGLLVLPSKTDLHAHPLVQSGSLILQDKSSCFSAEALLGDVKTWMGSTNGGDIIDCCAAPGNKTTHAGSLLKAVKCIPSPHVFAFEKDKKRLALLRQRCEQAGGAGSITASLQDFLSVDPDDARFQRVRGILLDPSCSGSGIVTAPDRWRENDSNDINNEKAAARVTALSKFQFTALMKSFSFSQVKRVVYSTCSIHVEENEGVVASALAHDRQKIIESGGNSDIEGWRLAPCLQKWHRRGLYAEGVELTEEEVSYLVRASPETDKTNGFFVALFVRGKDEFDRIQSAAKKLQKKRQKSCNKKKNQKKRKREAELEGKDSQPSKKGAPEK